MVLYNQSIDNINSLLSYHKKFEPDWLSYGQKQMMYGIGLTYAQGIGIIVNWRFRDFLHFCS